MLVDHKSVSQLLDAVFASGFAFLHCHVFFEVVVQYWVNEIASISLSTLVNLLKSSKVVHPVQLSSWLLEIVSTHQKVNLVWSLSECCCEFSSHILCGSFNTELETSSVFLELEVSLNIVSELISVCLFAWGSYDLELVEIHNFVFIVFQGEDWSIDCAVSHYDNPVLACDSEACVHCNRLLTKYL